MIFMGLHLPLIKTLMVSYLLLLLKHRYLLHRIFWKGQYFRFGVAGGGCSGFNYLFDIAEKPEADDVQFFDSPPALIDRSKS